MASATIRCSAGAASTEGPGTQDENASSSASSDDQDGARAGVSSA